MRLRRWSGRCWTSARVRLLRLCVGAVNSGAAATTPWMGTRRASGYDSLHLGRTPLFFFSSLTTERKKSKRAGLGINGDTLRPLFPNS